MNSVGPDESQRPDAGSAQAGGAAVEIAPGVFVADAAMRFAFARSSGPGGQNVNKLNTKAELWVDLSAVRGLSESARQRLARLAGRRVTSQGALHLSAETSRSQERNRQAVLEKLRELVIRAQVEPRPRKKTRPSRAARERRLQAKRHRSQTKSQRRLPGEG